MAFTYPTRPAAGASYRIALPTVHPADDIFALCVRCSPRAADNQDGLSATPTTDSHHGQAATPTKAITPEDRQVGTMDATLNSQDVLVWDTDGLDAEPLWTREPSTTAIEIVCRKHLHIDSNATCSISFHAEGAFNKLYLVKVGDSSWLMRISLPVCPRQKTRSEVTTMKWVRENTTIPVPRVFAFDDSNANEIGFEWILMEFMPGQTAYNRWRKLSMAQKVFFTQRVAEFQGQLFRHNFPAVSFRGIGTLDSGAEQEGASPGCFINADFFIGDRIKCDVPRGPFRSSHDWLRGCLDVSYREGETLLTVAEDEDDRKEAEQGLEAARRLRDVLPRIFPSIQDPPERTALYHHDLNLAHMLIDEQGNITAVLDWECVSALPLWQTARVPEFISGSTREAEPERDIYPNEDPVDPTTASEAPEDPDGLDNEGKNMLYWIHLLEYDQTVLRKIYHDKMRSLWPDWDLQIAESQLKRDFYYAVSVCPNIFFDQKIIKWVDKIEACEVVDLPYSLNCK